RVSADALNVRHDHRDSSREVVHSSHVIIANRQYQNHLPRLLWNRHIPVGDDRGWAIGATASRPPPAGNYVQLVPLSHDSPEIALKLGPRALIVLRSLGHHIRHQ